MIPYFEQPHWTAVEAHSLELFGRVFEIPELTFHAFGALVVMAILVGSWMIQKRSQSLGLDPDKSYDMVTWLLVGAFICSHLFEVLVYHPEKLQEDPWTLLRLWEGMSSYGGYLGAALGIAAYSWQRLYPGQWWRYIDAVAWGFPFGWIFGRLGCSVAVDHPGLPTDFFLGFQRPNGTTIHNLGFYEMLYTVGIACLFYALRNKRVWSGFWVGFLWIIYSPVRFGLDFLRVRDVKYAGLTPGQWGAIAMTAVALAIFFRRREVGDREPYNEPEDDDEPQAQTT